MKWNLGAGDAGQLHFEVCFKKLTEIQEYLRVTENWGKSGIYEPSINEFTTYPSRYIGSLALVHEEYLRLLQLDDKRSNKYLKEAQRLLSLFALQFSRKTKCQPNVPFPAISRGRILPLLLNSLATLKERRSKPYAILALGIPDNIYLNIGQREHMSFT